MIGKLVFELNVELFSTEIFSFISLGRFEYRKSNVYTLVIKTIC